MKKRHSIPTVPFRRKREKRTNYKKRMALLKSDEVRLVLRRFNKNVTAQLVQYYDEGDKVLATVHSSALKKIGKKSLTGNITEGYLTGIMIAKKAKVLNIQKAIVDIGLHTTTKGSRLYAIVKGAIDGGLDINADEKMFPDEDKIKGKDAGEFEKLKGAITK